MAGCRTLTLPYVTSGLVFSLSCAKCAIPHDICSQCNLPLVEIYLIQGDIRHLGSVQLPCFFQVVEREYSYARVDLYFALAEDARQTRYVGESKLLLRRKKPLLSSYYAGPGIIGQALQNSDGLSPIDVMIVCYEFTLWFLEIVNQFLRRISSCVLLQKRSWVVIIS